MYGIAEISGHFSSTFTGSLQTKLNLCDCQASLFSSFFGARNQVRYVYKYSYDSDLESEENCNRARFHTYKTDVVIWKQPWKNCLTHCRRNRKRDVSHQAKKSWKTSAWLVIFGCCSSFSIHINVTFLQKQDVTVTFLFSSTYQMGLSKTAVAPLIPNTIEANIRLYLFPALLHFHDGFVVICASYRKWIRIVIIYFAYSLTTVSVPDAKFEKKLKKQNKEPFVVLGMVMFRVPTFLYCRSIWLQCTRLLCNCDFNIINDFKFSKRWKFPLRKMKK